MRNDYQSVVNDNRRRLMALAMSANCTLLLDQLDTLLEELRLKAKVAGDAKWIPDRAKKIITRPHITAWWTRKIEELMEGARRAGHDKAR